MKKIFTLLFLSLLCGAQQLMAQDFRPYKGICWGTFYYFEDLTPMDCAVLAVPYERHSESELVLPNFVGCGKDLVVTISPEANEESHHSVYLEMEGGQYDTSGYFYPPFASGDYKWTIEASNGELMGPFHMYYSYYHEDLDYLGLMFLSYPDVHFAYLDVKLDQDYYEDYPRQYIDEEDVDGIQSVNAPVQTEGTYYDFAGRRTSAAAPGLKIVNGRKVIK